MDKLQLSQMALELADLCHKHATEVCRIADKYGEPRNEIVQRDARTYLKTANLTDFDKWEVAGNG